MDEEAREALRRHPLFRALAPADVDALAPAVRLRRYARGEAIFREGEPSDHFFSVIEGRVKVFKVTPGGKEVILEIFDRDDPLGAVAVYEQRPYPASATALDSTVCLAIPSAELLKSLELHPSLVRGLLVGLTRRLLELTRRISELTGGRVEPRLARLFLKLGQERGEHREEGVFVPLPLSRQELADLTGTTIETCIRIMSRWGKEELVRTEPDGFTLLDGTALERLADG